MLILVDPNLSYFCPIDNGTEWTQVNWTQNECRPTEQKARIMGLSMSYRNNSFSGCFQQFTPPNRTNPCNTQRSHAHTPDSPVVHWTVHCSLSGAPSRWSDTAADRWCARFSLRTSHRTVRWSSLHNAT